jgi:hypothetical protein
VVSEHQVYLPLIIVPRPPTATPTPTRTPASPGGQVYILPNHSAFISAAGFLIIVGEVRNDSPYFLRNLRIDGEVLDGSGQVVGIDFTYTFLDNVAPGERTCFQLSLNEPAGWSSYRFAEPTYRTDGRAPAGITILSHSGSLMQYIPWYRVSGQLRNDHGSPVQYVEPVGTLYNGAGTVIGCFLTMIGATLQPGETSSFEITFANRHYEDAASYRLQVDGRPL